MKLCFPVLILFFLTIKTAQAVENPFASCRDLVSITKSEAHCEFCDKLPPGKLQKQGLELAAFAQQREFLDLVKKQAVRSLEIKGRINKLFTNCLFPKPIKSVIFSSNEEFKTYCDTEIEKQRNKIKELTPKMRNALALVGPQKQDDIVSEKSPSDFKVKTKISHPFFEGEKISPLTEAEKALAVKMWDLQDRLDFEAEKPTYLKSIENLHLPESIQEKSLQEYRIKSSRRRHDTFNKEMKSKYLEIIKEMPVLLYLKNDSPTNTEFLTALLRTQANADKAKGKLEAINLNEMNDEALSLLELTPMVESVLAKNKNFCSVAASLQEKLEANKSQKNLMQAGVTVASALGCVFTGPVAPYCLGFVGAGFMALDVSEARNLSSKTAEISLSSGLGLGRPLVSLDTHLDSENAVQTSIGLGMIGMIPGGKAATKNAVLLLEAKKIAADKAARGVTLTEAQKRILRALEEKVLAEEGKVIRTRTEEIWSAKGVKFETQKINTLQSIVDLNLVEREVLIVKPGNETRLSKYAKKMAQEDVTTIYDYSGSKLYAPHESKVFTINGKKYLSISKEAAENPSFPSPAAYHHEKAHIKRGTNGLVYFEKDGVGWSSDEAIALKTGGRVRDKIKNGFKLSDEEATEFLGADQTQLARNTAATQLNLLEKAKLQITSGKIKIDDDSYFVTIREDGKDINVFMPDDIVKTLSGSTSKVTSSVKFHQAIQKEIDEISKIK